LNVRRNYERRRNARKKKGKKNENCGIKVYPKLTRNLAVVRVTPAATVTI